MLASFALGKRTADNARRFMVELAGRLVMPKPGAGDAHAFEAAKHIYVTQISTDGWPGYPEAVDLAFGGRAKFGVIIKEYRNAGMQYDPSEMVGTERRVIRGNISQWAICTSHVERNNGTIRTFMRRFTRLSNAFSKKLENHAAAVAMFAAYYNFVWRTRYRDNSGKPGKLRPTAAMMAKVVPDLWSFDRLYDEVIRYG